MTIPAILAIIVSVALVLTGISIKFDKTGRPTQVFIMVIFVFAVMHVILKLNNCY